MIDQNLKEILKKIESIKKEKKLSQPIQLIAVSKTFPASCVAEAYQAGHRVFGENKVQEGEQKKEELKQLPIEWHLIGHLQTNKAKKAAEIFDWIHSIDSFRLAEKVSKACQELGKRIKILIQINTSFEESKSGMALNEQIIQEEIKKIKELPNLELQGFMTIGPLTEESSLVRKSFIALRDMRDKIQKAFPELNLKELSMGMSSDFEIALEEGATMIRVGSLIFGKRNYSV